MTQRLLLPLLLLITALPATAAHWIGPISVPNPAKSEALAATKETISDEDYVYEDDRMIVWFDFSSGGVMRGVWLKDRGKVLRSKNSLGEEVPTNIIYGGGYQLLAGEVARPDSPYGNFMIFAEHNPRPALPGGKYAREQDGVTEIGFVGWLYDQGIRDVPGFDPNNDPVKPEYQEPNVYLNESWPANTERWVHLTTDSTTHQMKFAKRRGDGKLRRISYRTVFRIHHNQAKLDTLWNVFIYNKPELATVLICMDTLHEENPDGNGYVKSLGITGMNTASWNASFYDCWLGIPPGKTERTYLPKGRSSVMRHIEKRYPGNGATSFVVFKPQLREQWIEIYNGNRDASGRVTCGLDVTIRRDWTNIKDCSHFGFTDTPWYDGTKLGNWWITNEVALRVDGLTKDLEVRSFGETLSFRLGR